MISHVKSPYIIPYRDTQNITSCSFCKQISKALTCSFLFTKRMQQNKKTTDSFFLKVMNYTSVSDCSC